MEETQRTIIDQEIKVVIRIHIHHRHGNRAREVHAANQLTRRAVERREKFLQDILHERLAPHIEGL